VQLRDAKDEFSARGAKLAAIGMGWPEAAAHFRDTYEIPFPLLVDHAKETYRALEFKRSAMRTLGPQVWLGFAKNMISGHRSALAKEDPMQLSGAVVADTSGQVLFLHRAGSSSDNAPVESLLQAIP
jgi:AhpC/TSA antioxidant enzyme